ncbi:tripartite tricarboxylate transporter TctB family protein [Phaeobacter sp. C3_T13_0]|uniref:tripartite tricarboxylate transporter TctB family protein n=1 Tax=Phaeobacter cretensis TaxID=3342641 RepID=UPI0039BCB556
MTQERIIGGGVVVFGALLLLVVIPAHVTSMPGSPTDPGLFPKMAAWIFIALGLAQVALARETADAGIGLVELGRLALVTVILAATGYAMEHYGHIPAMTGLMIASVLLVYERRWQWIAVTVLLFPIGCWSLFEIVLERPLP